MAYGALTLVLPIDAVERGGIRGGFAVPGMLAVGSAFINLPGALAITRCGHKMVMMAGLGLAVLATVLLGARQDSLLLMGLETFFCGLGIGAWSLARLAYLADVVPEQSRGRVIAPVAAMQRLGLFVGPLLAGFASDAWGHRAPLLLAGSLLCLSWLVVTLGLAPGRVQVPVAAGVSPQNPCTMLTCLVRRHRHELAAAGVVMSALALLRSCGGLLLSVGGTVVGLTTSDIGVLKSLSTFIDLALCYPAGHLNDRLGRKATAVTSLTMLSLGVLLMGWGETYAVLAVAAVLAGLGNGLACGIGMTLAGDFSPVNGRAEFLGVWRLTSDIGAAASPLLLSVVAHALAVSAASTLAAAVGIIGMAVLIYWIRDPRVPT